MPYVSKVFYPSTGTPTPLSVPFPFISKAHVKLYLNDTPTTAFTWLNSSTILPSVVPPSGGVIEIKRQTPTAVRLVDFSDGSTLTAEALDISSTQMLYIVQEAYDSLVGTLGVGADGTIDALNCRIKNLGSPLFPNDAATKSYVDTVFKNSINSLAAADRAEAAALQAVTLVDVLSQPQHVKDALAHKGILLVMAGQSNALGANSGGLNPANPKVKVWNGLTSSWGSSDYTKLPWTLSSPDGNGGNNNIALSLAHRLTDETGRPVFIVLDATGGTAIEAWTASGTSSIRYAALKSKVEAALATPEVIAAGVTKVDVLLWAQGEENALTTTHVDYRNMLKTLVNQLRAETWMPKETPMLITGMSGLHQRYQIGEAQRDFCENSDSNCVFVSSSGLKTEYDLIGSGDYTHWLGESLWTLGYERAFAVLAGRGYTHQYSPPPFYARGTGKWRGEATAIAQFDHLVSRESASGEFPFNAHAAAGSIAWGYKCVSDGNYTMAGGYQVATGNVCNYSVGWGRDITFTDAADSSAGFGNQTTLSAPYTFAAGRGHTVADSGGSALGTFSAYKTAQANPVVHQIGIGTSLAAAKNAVTVRADGLMELLVSSTADPEKNSEASIQLVNNTTLKLKARGTDGVVRSVTLTLS